MIRLNVWLPSLLILVLLSLLLTVRLPADNPFWVSLQNSGHSIVFALLLAAFFFLFNGPNKLRSGKTLVAACGASLAAAAGSEFAQQFLEGRSATVSDFYIDLTGIIAGALVCLALFSNAPRMTKRILGATGVALALVPFYQPMAWAAAYKVRDTNVPLLLGFDSRWEGKFYFTNDSEFERSHPPAEWKEKRGSDYVGRITYHAGRWPTFKFQNIYPDWRDYNNVSFDLFNAENERVRMTFRVDDKHHNYTEEDRLDYRFWAPPGHSRIEIPLEMIRHAPKSRETDLSQIKDVMWSANRIERPIRIYLDNVRLD